MSLLIVIALYALRILRRPLDGRLKKRYFGPIVVAVLAVDLGLVWNEGRPTGVDGIYFLGDLAGLMAVYMMTLSLVLATRIQWLEPWFGGLDRMYLWHKRYSLWAIALIAFHIVSTQWDGGRVDPGESNSIATGLALGIVSAVALGLLVLISLPKVSSIIRLPYERWLFIHRFIGVLVGMSVLHGWLLDPVLASSGLADSAYPVIATVGLISYVYAELVRRRQEPSAHYTIRSVSRPGEGIVDVTLHPADSTTPLPIAGGQFVYLKVGGEHAWYEHPFSVAGVNGDGAVRLTIRALGDATRDLHADLRTGTPATLSGPYGMFDHTLGGARQIWIGAGIGIAPFLGWLDRTDAPLPSTDLYYCTSSPDQAPFLSELSAAAESAPALRLHPVFSSTDGRLTAARVLGEVGPIGPDVHIFLCGPDRMLSTLIRDLRRSGISRDHLHTEHFAFR
ncbi:ferric reductase-like transmembrane domain-containing protein [Streptomyces sp. NPDC005374]|uniref:ferredoxin reductase family protein n=1 Tax=Streptomyces sp. NPDC005374 TaxID=3364713 RepID=UPI0036B58FFF